MDKAVQVCIKCNTSLAIGLKLHFCPYCGTAQLEKKLLDEKSTSNYDPRNPAYKPWRDKPAVPKRIYKPVDANTRPWCPAMRQPRLRSKKLIPRVENSASMAGESTIDQETEGYKTSTIEEKESVAEFNDGEIEQSNDAEGDELIPVEPFIGLYTEVINPVAVYDAERWMAVGGMAVNVSLVEQTLGDVHHAYWLRIGVLFDEDLKGAQPPTRPSSPVHAAERSVALSETDAEAASTLGINTSPMERDFINENTTKNEGQMYTIAMLSSDVGKLMVPGVDDWVDLSAVDSTEYYMVRHLERVLQSIANRVVTANLNELALRQTYHVHVRRRTKQSKFADALSSVGGGLPLLAVERLSAMHTSSAAWSYNANQIVCRSVPNASNGNSPKGHMMSRTSSSISVCFQDWVVQLSHRLVLTRGISVRHYPSLVRVSFRYEDRLTDPQLFPGVGFSSAPASVAKPTSAMEPHLTEDEPLDDAIGKYVDPRVAERNKKLHFFAASQRITHAVLHITPTAVSLKEVVPPAELSFDVHSMRHLLRDHAPNSLDEMVAEGKKSVLLKFATRLVSLVRLEHTNAGVKYAVVGAFSEPPHETCGWPLDVPSFMDEDLDDFLLLEQEVEEDEVNAGEVGEETKAVPVPVPVPPLDVVEEDAEEKIMTVAQEEVSVKDPIVETGPEPGRPPVPEMEVMPPCPPPPQEVEFVEPCCPIHSVLCSLTPDMCGCARTHCKCLHQSVTLKGSEVMLWADFSELDGVSSLRDADAPAEAKGEEDTLILPSTVEGAAYLGCTRQLSVVNKLRIVAVDQIDPDLTCEVVLSAERVLAMLRLACTASTAADEQAQSVEGIMRIYTVPATGPVRVDLMQHRALRRLCFDFLCEGAMLDLFLSRKSRLMKLIVKP